MDVKNGTHAIGYENVLPQGAATVSTAQVLTKNVSPDAHQDDSTNENNSSDNSTMYSCLSEGSEVDVEGGVALTKEAVETHTPDILAVDMKDAVILRDIEMEESDDDGADIGLQGIMTQV